MAEMVTAPPPLPIEDASALLGTKRGDAHEGPPNSSHASKRRRAGGGTATEPAFPAARVREILERGGYASEVCDGAAVYLSAVLEQITGRLLGSAGVLSGKGAAAAELEMAVAARTLVGGLGEAKGKTERRIEPKAIQRALAKDPAMLRCLAGLAAVGAGEEASDWLAGKCVCLDGSDSALVERRAEEIRVALVHMGLLPVQAPGYEDASRVILRSLSKHQVPSPAFASLLLQASTRELWQERARSAMLQQEARRLAADLDYEQQLNRDSSDDDGEDDGEEEEEGKAAIVGVESETVGGEKRDEETKQSDMRSGAQKRARVEAGSEGRSRKLETRRDGEGAGEHRTPQEGTEDDGVRAEKGKAPSSSATRNSLRAPQELGSSADDALGGAGGQAMGSDAGEAKGRRGGWVKRGGTEEKEGRRAETLCMEKGMNEKREAVSVKASGCGEREAGSGGGGKMVGKERVGTGEGPAVNVHAGAGMGVQDEEEGTGEDRGEGGSGVGESSEEDSSGEEVRQYQTSALLFSLSLFHPFSISLFSRSVSIYPSLSLPFARLCAFLLLSSCSFPLALPISSS